MPLWFLHNVFKRRVQSSAFCHQCKQLGKLNSKSHVPLVSSPFFFFFPKKHVQSSSFGHRLKQFGSLYSQSSQPLKILDMFPKSWHIDILFTGYKGLAEQCFIPKKVKSHPFALNQTAILIHDYHIFLYLYIIFYCLYLSQICCTMKNVIEPVLPFQLTAVKILLNYRCRMV